MVNIKEFALFIKQIESEHPNARVVKIESSSDKELGFEYYRVFLNLQEEKYCKTLYKRIFKRRNNI